MKRQKIPNGQRRAEWHDYYSRSIYMITLNAAPGIPSFSQIQGEVGSHENPPVAVKSQLGEIIAWNLSALKSRFGFIKILRRVIMPEHVHFVIFITERTEYHLGTIIADLKRHCSRDYAEFLHDGLSYRLRPVFEEGYHDRILLKNGQLQRMLDYVSDNPTRRLIRLQHPELFSRKPLPEFEGTALEAYGNLQLLADPDIEAVKVSSKYSKQQLYEAKLCWKHTVQNCGILASPFVSKAEKAVRNWSVDHGGRFIYILGNGFGPRYTPKGIRHKLCAEGRLLMIAPAVHLTEKVKRDKPFWERMNRLAKAISDGSYRLR